MLRVGTERFGMSGQSSKKSGRLVESNRHSAFRHEAIVDEDDAASFLARMDDLHAVGEQS